MYKYLENISFLKSKKITGVEIYIPDNGSYNINIVTLKKVKNSLNVEKKAGPLTQIDLIKNNVDISVPVVLSIGGKGIIFKSIENTGNNNLLSGVFPNAAPDLFYVQKYYTENEKAILSVARKDLVDKIIAQIVDEGLLIDKVFLGPFASHYLHSFINEEKIVTDNYEIEFSGSSIKNLLKNDSSDKTGKFLIGDEVIGQDYIIAFANAFSFYSGSGVIEYDNDEPETNREKILYKNAFVYLGWAFMIFIFSLLFINYIFYEHYRKKQENLQTELGYNSKLFEKLEQLKKDLVFKKEMVEKNGLLYASKLSFYADEIAYTVPDRVELEKMNLCPQINKLRSSEEIILDKDIINLTGTADNSSVINDWLKELKNKSWVKKITMVEYKQESLSEKGWFNIEIVIKH